MISNFYIGFDGIGTWIISELDQLVNFSLQVVPSGVIVVFWNAVSIDLVMYCIGSMKRRGLFLSEEI